MTQRERSVYQKLHERFFAPIEGGVACGLCHNGVFIGTFLDHLEHKHSDEWKSVCERLKRMAADWTDMQRTLKWSEIEIF